MKVSPSQMRSSVMTLRVRVDHRKLGLREAEWELMKEHLDANERLLDGLEAHPDILSDLRKAMLAARGVSV